MTGAVVLATDQGLGYLAKAFYDNGIVDIVHIKEHSSRKTHYEWYPDRVSEEELLEKCDTLIFFETPFNWKLIPMARERGIKTILMPMYECTQYPFPYEPDQVWCPSALDYQFYTERGQSNCVQVQVPVAVKHATRLKACTFVHNAGNGGLGGRNGTKELIEAIKHVKSPIRLIIRSQVPIKEVPDERIEYRVGNFDDIWSEGDVFIFPEKFNGLSLPLQEAFASGMAVMAGNRFPTNTWLPKEILIPVSGYHQEKIAVPFECAEYTPEDIAKTIDDWYGKDIEHLSLLGKEFGEKNSWNIQKKRLRDLLGYKEK